MPTRHLRAVAGLTLLAALLRLPTLALQSFWLDEAVTAGLVRRPFGTMLSALPGSESTPPLPYVLLWAWSHVFGSGEAGLRSFSALIGIATVPFAYAAASRLVSPRAGLVAAALAATNPLLVWYSQEARAYALLVFLTAVSLTLFARLEERPDRRATIGWAVACVLALASHYFALFVIAPQAILLLLRRRGRAELAAVAAIVVAGGALLPLALSQRSHHSAEFIGRSSLGRRLLQVPKQDLLGFSFPHQAVPVVLAVALAVVGVGLLATRGSQRERRGAGLASLLALPTLLVPLLLAIVGVDYFITRNLLAAWLPLAVALAAGLGAARAGKVGVAAAAALCLLGVFVVIEVDANPPYQRDDWRAVARALGPPTRDRAIVIDPLNGRVALSAYLPRLVKIPQPAVLVREIDLVAVVRRSGSGTPTPPRPVTPTPPGGFVVVERRDRPTYTFIRMVSAPLRLVNQVDPLTPLRLADGPADFAFQPALVR